MFDDLLTTPTELADRVDDGAVAVVDCRFDLSAPERGAREYAEAHIPGAVYAHLDRDLSGPKTGRNGRHPLPSTEQMVARFSQWGIDDAVHVVAYDAGPGQIAARLWWMLRYLGHDRASVLDGGMQAWRDAGLPLRSGTEHRKRRPFVARPRESRWIGLEALANGVRVGNTFLVDARAAERYRGEKEEIDPVAGHIPGARNHPWEENLDERGRFLPASVLRDRWNSLLTDARDQPVVVYCGSGVTACHDLLALEIIGHRGARLYPGSWSEWCADRARPIETGSPSEKA